jgi:hypothetical protein
MYSVTTFLPLFVLATGVLAAPTPLGPVARAVPALHEVIRNPSPINERLGLDIDLLEAIKLGLDIHARTIYALKEEAAPPVVVDRSVSVDESI